jgi:hypothetical protein
MEPTDSFGEWLRRWRILLGLTQLFAVSLTLLRLRRTSDADRDLEILILRQQLGILQPRQDKPIKPNRAEKFILAVLANTLKEQTKPLVNKSNS